MNEWQDRTELAFRVMSWLNDTRPSCEGGLFNTPYGVLELKWQKSQWRFAYHELEELPEWMTNEL